MNKISPNKFQRFVIKRMGIDKYVEEWEKNKHKYSQLDSNSDEDYEHRENSVWYKGNAQQLEYFYKSNFGPNIINQYKFWQMINTQMPRLHYPLASTISNAMGTLLFNQKPSITIDAGSKVRNKKLQERLDEILEVNDFQALLQEGARMQSYSGAVGLKSNFDDTISDMPLITLYPKGEFKVHKKYNQVMYIDFYDYYDGDYKLVSRYGRGYINYMLYKGKERTSLSALEETSALKDIAISDEDGNLFPYIFATVIGNKSKEGQSDYSDIKDTFHGLDETYSTLMTYIRRTKPNIFITEDIAKKDASGKVLPLNEFDNIVTVLDQAIGDNASKIERSIEEVKIQGYKDALDKLRNTVLEKVSISPATIGIDNAGGNASGEALRLRERASIKTRDEKLVLWNEGLKDFIVSLMNFDLYLTEAVETESGILLSLNELQFDVKIDFGEYIKISLQERSDVYVKLHEKGIVSTEFAINQVFGNQLNEEELMQLIIETKIENGKPLSQSQEEWLKEREKLNN